jgi:P27 family predicted phage terminase small subunit
MRGRKPKPTSIKTLSGNPGRRPVNTAEPRFRVPERTPRPPAFLSDSAAEVWRDLGKLLREAGLFTVVDRYALAMFCAVAARWMRAEREIERLGVVLIAESGNLYQNPWLHIANKAWGQMRQMLSEFGLTPAERSRLKVATTEEEPTLAEMLFQMSVDDGD